MSHVLTTPSLSVVLGVLNIVLALVWVLFPDFAYDPTKVFHAVLVINATTTVWWIWMNTSASRVARALCRFAISAVHLLGPPLAMLQAPRLMSLRVGNIRDDQKFVLAPAHSPSSPARYNSAEIVVEEDLLETPEHADASDEPFSGDRASVHPAALILHGSRSWTPSHPDIPPIYKLSPDDPIPISNLAPSRTSLSDAQLPENVRLKRAVRILTRERDAQTRYALERAEAAAIDTQHALQRLEAERRDLSVALAATLTAPGGKAAPSVVSADHHTATQDVFAHRARPSAGDISSPQTPIKHSGADERPLLLPPTAETTDDTPTRPRNATWASPGRSRLEDILMHTRRRAEVLAQAQKQGVGAVWDAQRAASARPLFSVVHEGIKGDRAGVVEEPVLTAEQKGAYAIIDDLRVSRPRTSPSTSPVLEQGNNHPAVTVSEEQVPCQQEEVAQKPGSDTLAAQKTAAASDTLAVPMQAMPVRQPRGPPPSPLATLAQKAIAQAIGRQPSAHTWRGRTQGGSGTGVLGADAAVKPVLGRASTFPDPPSQTQPTTTTTYPTSRMPNRVHARQATAPPDPTSKVAAHKDKASVDPMVILQAALPGGGVPKVAVSPMTGAVGGSGKSEERRRHATYSGAGAVGSPAFASANLRWQASASGREAIEAERRVAETAEEINLLLRGLLHKTSSRALVAEPVAV